MEGRFVLRTLLLLFQFRDHEAKQHFVLAANIPLAGTLITAGDAVIDIFTIQIEGDNTLMKKSSLKPCSLQQLGIFRY